MSSTINDSERVKALLDSLRASQAWQNIVNNQSSTTPPAPATGLGAETGPSVASLLSQLSVPQNPPTAPNPSLTSAVLNHASPPGKDPLPGPSTPVTEDVRSLTFQQALPRLAQLAADPVLVAALEKLKQEQDKIERNLWQERAAIRSKYEEKVKVAKTKATLIGTGLSKREAEMLSQAYERELRKFDKERVLPAWDGLVTSQQSALAQLKIPTMFSTAVKTDRERQQRVMQVLEGIVGT